MKIALVGYGKMGHLIEEVALSLGHDVVTTIDIFADDAKKKVAQGDVSAIVNEVVSKDAQGIIEFTNPATVMENIRALLPTGIPLVVGTTGWNDKKDEVAKFAATCNGTIMTSANFSIGVNIFYKIVEEAARLVNNFSEYDACVWEMHHNQKVDSPSGTAIEIAKKVMAGIPQKNKIVTDAFYEKPKPNELHISSARCGTVPGTHKVFFDSNADTIELTHTARSRQGFALGAVHAVINLKKFIDEGKLSRGKLYGISDVFPNMF